jgi:hypothetical protein
MENNIDKREVPVPLLDTRYPAQGLGKSSDDQPNLPSRQPVATPKDVTKRKK